MLRLYSSKAGYLVVCGDATDSSALYISRSEPRMRAVKAGDGRALLGITPTSLSESIKAVLGRLDVDGESYLFVVSEASHAATLTSYDKMEYPVMRVDRVRAIPLTNTTNSNGQTITTTNSVGQGLGNAGKSALSKLRSGKQALMKIVNDKINPTSSMLEEILKLFNPTPTTSDFYYCVERDITQSTQRHFEHREKGEPDERFFWNRHMLDDLYAEGVDEELTKPWRLPITQGFASSTDLVFTEDGGMVRMDEEGEKERERRVKEGGEDERGVLRVTLLSRRGVKRAGARYLRRGIDEDANVANFVETELLLNNDGHHVSFIQVRGSVPVFWCQQGMRYRPPLSITRTIDESMPYFVRHLERMREDYKGEMEQTYGDVVAVNLVDQSGRELALAHTFAEHALRANKDWLHLYLFDFHRYCKGLSFDKVSLLVCELSSRLSSMGYCWVDKEGRIASSQRGVVRTNCVDCLDRTNVVQSAISFKVCMDQAMRMAVFGPCTEPPEALVEALRMMWADNGDAISRQYAGTAALKASMTRGENKWFGMVKDGMSSVRRYYLYLWHDATRQRAINVLLNEPDQAPEKRLSGENGDDEDEEGEEQLNENLQRLLRETTDFVLPENEVLICGWPLVNASTGGDEVDTVLLLTRTSVYVAMYDEDAERLEDVHIVPLMDVERIEIGRPSRNARSCLRLVTKQGAWALRPSSARLFNNVIIGLKNGDEADEYVESIAEQLRVTFEMMIGGEWSIGRPVRLETGSSQGRNMKVFGKVASAFRAIKQRTSGEASRAGAGGEIGGGATLSAPQPSAVFHTSPPTPATEQPPAPLIDLLSPDDTRRREEVVGGGGLRLSQSEGGLAALMKRGLRGSSSSSTANATALDPFASLKEKVAQSKSVVHFM